MEYISNPVMFKMMKYISFNKTSSLLKKKMNSGYRKTDKGKNENRP